MIVKSWTNAYVGTPFDRFGASHAGCNCWGLVVLIYAEQLGITLPDYAGAYASPEEQAEVAALVAAERADPAWTRVFDARPLDVLLFRRGHLDTHVGLYVDRGLMLHVTADDCAKLERFETGTWGHRLTGIYRHVKAASNGVSGGVE
ncbi:C40 family peptidase [Pleomorphomonas koreensis]|uniref:C40 family peptidase n=1 Tax=Pleomorphomonas koreensis TaxID=257440 RepID=UPI00041AC73E|nr:NlpC/P60 family protein [Pleomorphomonas koreensis]